MAKIKSKQSELSEVISVDGELFSIGGTLSRSIEITTSGGGVSSTYVDAQDAAAVASGKDYTNGVGAAAVASGQGYTNSALSVLSGNITSDYLANDLLISGSLQNEIDILTINVGSSSSYHTSVYNEIEKLYSTSGDVILTSSGLNDLNLAISGLTEGQILEIKSSAVFSPITIPSGVSFKVKVSEGYFPTLSGQDCIKISDGAADVILTGLFIENCTSSYSNGKGAAIAFKTNHAKAQNLIFHNITIYNATGSAIMLAYYNDADYATSPTLNQMSEKLAFISCHIYKGSTDATEGAALTLRGCIDAFIADCQIDAENISRGIQLQNCIRSVVEGNYISNCSGGGNGEGIKIDEIGTISGYRNSAVIRNNFIKKCIEGIDIDDVSSCNVIQNNIISECTGEGISLDGGTPNGIAAIIGNTCYKNAVGIRLESGSIGVLKKNMCYNNTTNYLIENGYSLDSSNTTALDNTFVSNFASLIKNDSSVPGTTVDLALNELDSTKQEISAGSVRPTAISGQMFFDTNLSPARPIWYDGTGWVDASGTSI